MKSMKSKQQLNANEPATSTTTGLTSNSRSSSKDSLNSSSSSYNLSSRFPSSSSFSQLWGYFGYPTSNVYTDVNSCATVGSSSSSSSSNSSSVDDDKISLSANQSTATTTKIIGTVTDSALQQWVDVTDNDWMTSTIEERWQVRHVFNETNSNHSNSSNSSNSNKEDLVVAASLPRKGGLCSRIVKCISIDLYYCIYTPLKWYGHRLDAAELVKDVMRRYYEQSSSNGEESNTCFSEEDDEAMVKYVRRLESNCYKMVRKLEAVPSNGAIRFLSWSLPKVWRCLFNNIQVDLASLQVLKGILDASPPDTPLLLLPTHKSHIDYLILSFIQYGFGLPVPHIAAGDNLDLPIIGDIFRRSGAFFIKRKVGGDKLYKATLEAYLTQLLRTGACVEFFIEGGRSRSGKVASPKLGLLGTIVNAVDSKMLRDVLIVPIAVDYDCIPEGKGYASMSLGRPKVKDGLGKLFNRSREFIKKYHGNIHVRYGAPLSCNKLIHSYRTSTTTTDDIGMCMESIASAVPSCTTFMSNSRPVTVIESVGSKIGEAITNAATITVSTIFAASLLSFTKSSSSSGSCGGRHVAVSEKQLIKQISICQDLLKIATRLATSIHNSDDESEEDGGVTAVPTPINGSGMMDIRYCSMPPKLIIKKACELFSHVVEVTAVESTTTSSSKTKTTKGAGFEEEEKEEGNRNSKHRKKSTQYEKYYRVIEGSQTAITELGMYRNMASHLIFPIALISKAYSTTKPDRTMKFLVKYLNSELPNCDLEKSVDHLLKAHLDVMHELKVLDAKSSKGKFLSGYLNPTMEAYSLFYESLMALTVEKDIKLCKKKDLVSYFLKLGSARFKSGEVLTGENMTLDTPTCALASLYKNGGISYQDRYSVIVLEGEHSLGMKLDKVRVDFKNLEVVAS